MHNFIPVVFIFWLKPQDRYAAISTLCPNDFLCRLKRAMAEARFRECDRWHPSLYLSAKPIIQFEPSVHGNIFRFRPVLRHCHHRHFCLDLVPPLTSYVTVIPTTMLCFVNVLFY